MKSLPKSWKENDKKTELSNVGCSQKLSSITAHNRFCHWLSINQDLKMEDFEIIVHVEGVEDSSGFQNILFVSLIQAPLQFCWGLDIFWFVHRRFWVFLSMFLKPANLLAWGWYARQEVARDPRSLKMLSTCLRNLSSTCKDLTSTCSFYSFSMTDTQLLTPSGALCVMMCSIQTRSRPATCLFPLRQSVTALPPNCYNIITRQQTTHARNKQTQQLSHDGAYPHP